MAAPTVPYPPSTRIVAGTNGSSFLSFGGGGGSAAAGLPFDGAPPGLFGGVPPPGLGGGARADLAPTFEGGIESRRGGGASRRRLVGEERGRPNRLRGVAGRGRPNMMKGELTWAASKQPGCALAHDAAVSPRRVASVVWGECCSV